MEQAVRRLTPLVVAAVSGEGDRPSTRFTPMELAAAEQLIHLSESSCSSGAAFSFTPRRGGVARSAASASSSSLRSVNAPPPTPGPPHDVVVDAEEEEDDDDEQEVGGRPRRNRRYRPIAEIYDAKGPAGGRRKNKDKAAGAGAREEKRK